MSTADEGLCVGGDVLSRFMARLPLAGQENVARESDRGLPGGGGALPHRIDTSAI